MGLEQTDYRGGENIGFHGVVTDAYALFPPDFPDSDLFDGTQVQDLRLNGTDLVGLFAAGNSNGLIVTDTIEAVEERRLDEHDVSYMIVDSDYTAIGNLVLCNDHGCIVSPHLTDRTDAIADVLDVPVETGTVAGLSIPGSCGVATNNGVLLHRQATEEELAQIEDVLGVSGDIGSVNFGSPYVHSGILANTDDLLVGPETTGPELQRIQDALGFL
jgi:translation initiation factor 6